MIATADTRGLRRNHSIPAILLLALRPGFLSLPHRPDKELHFPGPLACSQAPLPSGFQIELASGSPGGRLEGRKRGGSLLAAENSSMTPVSGVLPPSKWSWSSGSGHTISSMSLHPRPEWWVLVALGCSYVLILSPWLTPQQFHPPYNPPHPPTHTLNSPLDVEGSFIPTAPWVTQGDNRHRTRIFYLLP